MSGYPSSSESYDNLRAAKRGEQGASPFPIESINGGVKGVSTNILPIIVSLNGERYVKVKYVQEKLKILNAEIEFTNNFISDADNSS